MTPSIYENNLQKTDANYSPLSPLSFLRRASSVYPQHAALIYGDISRTWLETYTRCRKLAAALKHIGVGPGDTVSVMAPNIPAMYEVHFAVPATGAVLNTLNIRLDPVTIGFMLAHAETKVLITDREYSATVKSALAGLEKKPFVINIDDPLAEGGVLIGETEYESFLDSGDEKFTWCLPENEWQAISLNYTSGTTGNPKGVVYHHRGAHLNALNNIIAWPLPAHAVYLWTLPMFHCNGWCFPWSMAAVAGTNVCLRKVNADDILRSIIKNGVTHFCGAPVIMGMLLQAGQDMLFDLPAKVNIMTSGAPPPAAVLEKIEKMGFTITHVYGLTECFGPSVVCAWHSEWDELESAERAKLKARQGVRYHLLEDLMVADSDTLVPVLADGSTMGEVFMRGNILMKGYLKNEQATREAFSGGWFHTGDLAVIWPDGYIELKDRSKDIIISGGENISTIEVEGILYKHAAIQEVAVVARPDEKWGESVCAFVTLKKGYYSTEQELIAFCRLHLAGFKVPRTMIFRDLPKTATGKVQKYLLRKQAEEL
jgi:fatty-acyl-CoA synthase